MNSTKDSSSSYPFLDQIDGTKRLNSIEFIRIWKKYDRDGNGYIEKQELTHFLNDLAKDVNKSNINQDELERYKKDMLKAYDKNGDGRIELEELAHMLPVEDNFLLQFQRSNELSSSDFMKVWDHYDIDKSGYLEQDEMEGLVRDVLRRGKNSVTINEVTSYTKGALQAFDVNADGKLDMNEAMRMLPVEENFFLQFGAKKKLDRKEFKLAFAHYDKDNNGSIERYELDGLLKDLVQIDGLGLNMSVIESLKKSLLRVCDRNHDGRLQMDELATFLCYDRAK